MQALGEEYTRQESKGTRSSRRAKLRKTIWSLVPRIPHLVSDSKEDRLDSG